MHGDSEGVRRDRFVRLMEVLVGLVLLYGVEAWGGVEIADAGDQDFPLIGRLHLLVTLQYELNTYHASEVEGMRRCTEWVQNLEHSVDMFGWVGMIVHMEAL